MSEKQTEQENVIGSIQQVVKTRLVDQNPSVKESYIQKQVDAKIQSRIQLVEKAINSVAEATKELRKIKPDQVFYGVDGKVIQEAYTKELLDKKNKLVEKIEKIENALTKALEEADYSKLEELVK
jgi:chaperonin cofactor prefoldin